MKNFNACMMMYAAPAMRWCCKYIFCRAGKQDS
jgi:hypothetical protein